MIILCPYSETKRVTAQAETKEKQLNLLDKFQIIREPLNLEEDYYNFLCEYWRKDDLIIWEHDIVADYEDINELINCKYNLCSLNYFNITNTKSMHRVMINGDINKRRGITENDNFADFTGFGFIKINKNIQERINIAELKRKSWTALDTDFSYQMIENNIQAHIHHKILKHNHNVTDFI